MSDWIDAAADRARREDEDREDRELAFKVEAPSIWHGLQAQLEKDVGEINKNDELQRRRLGNHPLTIATDGNQLGITKSTLPAVYLTLTYRRTSIDIERETVTNGQNRHTTKERDSFSIVFADDDPSNILILVNKEGKALNYEEASEYLLTPLINAQQMLQKRGG